jgi:transposase-like protein
VRPPYEQLLADLREMSWVAVGRKYGVSDNAVRKWMRRYEAERGRQRAGFSRAAA